MKGSDNQAAFVAVIGSTGSGKSHFVKQVLATKPPRLMVWDAMREYGHVGKVIKGRTADLVAELRKVGRGRFALVYQPDKSTELRMREQFAVFCRAALAVRDVMLVIEELALVTKAGYSPPGWLEVVTGGRHYGLMVVGTSQRPALLDKTFFSNCTMIRVGKLSSAGDKKAVADAIDVNINLLRQLRPRQWLVKNLVTGDLTAEGVSLKDLTRAIS